MTPARRGSSLVMVGCGLLAGLLVANLVSPDAEVRTATSSLPTTVGEGTVASDVSADLADARSNAPGSAGGIGHAEGRATSRADPGDGAVSTRGSTGVGVTATSVKVGFIALDTSSLRMLGPGYDTGDTTEMWKALVDEARADGRLPVSGRDIEPYILTTPLDASPNAAANRRSECLKLAEDAKVFAVVAVIQIDRDCIAREFKTPLVTTLSSGWDADATRNPLSFNAQSTWERGFRNSAAWMLESGVLKGRRLGFYYVEDDQGRAPSYDVYQKNFLSILAAHGFTMAREVRYDSSQVGQESTHALQFKSADVDLIIDGGGMNLASGPSFMRATDALAYHPKYIVAGIDAGSTQESVTDNFAADQWAGTTALVDDNRSLEFGPMGRAGLTPASKKCADTIRQRLGVELDPVKTYTQWQYYQSACDALNVVITALRATGLNLTRSAYAASLSSVQLAEGQLGWLAAGTFGAERAWPKRVRVIRYDKDCTDRGKKACWRPEGGYRPFWVP